MDDSNSSSCCSEKGNHTAVSANSYTDTNSDTADIVYSHLDRLVKSAKNFNLHINVMKRLLNLETPQDGYAPDFSPTESQDLDVVVEPQQQVSMNMSSLQAKINAIRKEVDEMQVNSFCLAFNLQRQLKRLTGLPLDANATDDVVQDLWIRFNESKSSEAILKYEFEEKRKLLRRLRKELEQARRDWKNLKIRITDPSDASETADNELSEASQDSARLSSESDSAVHSDEGDDCNSSASIRSKSKQLGQLERECLQFVTQLVTTGGTTDSSSSRLQVPDEDDERFHSPMPVPDFYLHGTLMIDSSSEEDGSLVAVESDSDLDDDDDDDDMDLEAALAAEGGLTAFVDDLLNAGSSGSQLSPSAPDTPAGSLEPESGLFPQRSRTSSRSSRFDEEEEARLRQESLAETGEPIVLCRLRRKAVEVLVSRLREEKAFHETREKELESKLKDVTARNKQLEDQRGMLQMIRALHPLTCIPFFLITENGSIGSPGVNVMIGLTLVAINAFSALKMLSTN
jgi:hypothetical protein